MRVGSEPQGAALATAAVAPVWCFLWAIWLRAPRRQTYSERLLIAGRHVAEVVRLLGPACQSSFFSRILTNSATTLARIARRHCTPGAQNGSIAVATASGRRPRDAFGAL